MEFAFRRRTIFRNTFLRRYSRRYRRRVYLRCLSAQENKNELLGRFAEKVVPLMAVIYIASAVLILIIKYQMIPAAFVMIVKGAFKPMAATGDFAGSTVMLALRYGLSRGTASNEAGMGSAPFAHASAQTDFPARQGLWGIYDSDCHSGSIIVL